MKSPLVLNDDFKYVLRELENTRKSMFITGRAGTGKSTLLHLFRQTSQKKVVVVAPTGVAALNVHGQTIHSFFGFPPQLITPKEARKRPRFRGALKIVQKMDVLVIDEISMVRADLLDGIDLFLRFNRENPKPFGGVQVVFFGDLFQLPPVINRDPIVQQHFNGFYESPYFFSAHVMQDPQLNIEMMELGKVYRQDSRHFLRLLEAVRTAQFDYDDLEDLNLRVEDIQDSPPGYITLCATNASADTINAKALNQLIGPALTFSASVDGIFTETLYPTDPLLTLRLNAQVMFIRNDTEGDRFVNGTVGKVIELKEDKVIVEIESEDGDGKKIEVSKAEWEIIRYEVTEAGDIAPKTIGTFKQLPLKLAWAVTIHKSQGKTFDRVVIDLGRGAFEHGQLYVALSRCRTLQGIILKQAIRPNDIIMDERIVDFYTNKF